MWIKQQTKELLDKDVVGELRKRSEQISEEYDEKNKNSLEEIITINYF